jgi:protein-glutamine gamma-glutamyltransferase
VIPPALLRQASTDYPADIASIYLQLPATDPRIKQLAEEATRGAKNDYDKAASIERFLKTRYRYTLDLSGPKMDDPLAGFLFSKKAGNCEYFAAAMTVMLRSLGVPTRYVGGFLSSEYNDIGGDWVVRASDAHTWVEVYFKDYGWMTFDPTPAGDGKQSGFFASLGKYWDWFQFAWGEWVINYDFVHQMSFAQNVGRSSRNFGESARKYYQQKRDALIAGIISLDKKTEASPYFLPSVLVLLVVLLIFLRGRDLLAHLMARWTLLARHGDASPSLAVLEYREMLRLLEKAGWRKTPSQTADEFAAQISPLEIAGPVAQLTTLYQSARFGEHPAPIEQMSSLVASIRELIKRSKHPA